MHVTASDCYPVEVSIDGSEVQVPAMTITVTLAEIDEVLAAYDPASASSPPAATCRAIARPILDAIREAAEVMP